MNDAAAVPAAAIEATVPEPVCPPSLRRLAPARITLTCAGECVPMDGRKMHLLAGGSFAVEVKAQYPSAKVEITAEPPLIATVSTTRVQHGHNATYHAEFSACKMHLRILPLPKSTRLHVAVTDGENEPHHLTIPVKVWPPVSAYGLSAVLAFLGIVGLRVERMFAHENSFDDIVSRMLSDLPQLGMIGAACLLIAPITWLVGRIIGIADLGSAE